MRQERADAPRRSERPPSKDWCDEKNMRRQRLQKTWGATIYSRGKEASRSGSAVFERKLFRSGSCEE